MFSNLKKNLLYYAKVEEIKHFSPQLAGQQFADKTVECTM